MTREEIFDLFDSRNFKPLQEAYKKVNQGVEFSETCSSCTAYAKRVLLNGATVSVPVEVKQVEQTPKPIKNGNNRKNKRRK
jgi:hypothetical protein